MRITKFHLLLIFLLLAAGGYGFYFYKTKQEEAKRQEQERIQKELALQKQREDELKRQAEEAARAAPPPEPEKKEPSEILYTVQPGDTLWSIAKKANHFGKGNRWYDIWKANEDKVFDFDRIRAGQELVIPLDVPKGYAWPKTSEEKKEKLLKRKSPVKTKISPTN